MGRQPKMRMSWVRGRVLAPWQSGFAAQKGVPSSGISREGGIVTTTFVPLVSPGLNVRSPSRAHFRAPREIVCDNVRIVSVEMGTDRCLGLQGEKDGLRRVG